MRAAIEQGQRMAIEFQGHQHRRALGHGVAGAVVQHAGDAGIGKQRGVEAGGFFGLGVKPQAGVDAGLHAQDSCSSTRAAADLPGLA